MSAAVSVSTTTHKSVLTVPIQAVTSRAPKGDGDAGATQDAGEGPAGKPKPNKVVFVVGNDKKAQMRVVHTGIASRTDVEILDGLKEGETIVEGPYRTLARELADGQEVKVQPKDKPIDAKKAGT